ncbi:hypothetical protein PUN28_006751 [Cardiocondyla obscurior]|uniref:Ribosomal protein S12 n=1 Tax=Cardiocondyla obscurior TaxID=286306 RepID=A0AAW2G1Y0_9HYME
MHALRCLRNISGGDNTAVTNREKNGKTRELQKSTPRIVSESFNTSVSGEPRLSSQKNLLFVPKKKKKKSTSSGQRTVRKESRGRSVINPLSSIYLQGDTQLPIVVCTRLLRRGGTSITAIRGLHVMPCRVIEPRGVDKNSGRYLTLGGWREGRGRQNKEKDCATALLTSTNLVWRTLTLLATTWRESDVSPSRRSTLPA